MIVRSVARAATALIILAFLLTPLSAQRPSPITLKPANAHLSAEFTLVSSVRELSDGRVLVTDEKENRIVLADFRTKAISDIGRRGSGPGEYRQVGRLWPLRGDSSLMADRFQPRWLVLHGSRIVHTWSSDAPVVEAARGGLLMGADSSRVITIQPARTLMGRPKPRDSMRVLLIDRATGRATTIARAAPGNSWTSGPVEEAAASDAAASRKPIYVVSINAEDQVALFPDGWTAIARYRPYRIDWCAPRGKCTKGPVLEPTRPMNDREKRAHLEIAARTSGWPPTKSLDETTDWPDIVPPFVLPQGRMDGSALFPLRGGRLLIERFPSAQFMHWAYDLIDRRGMLLGRLTLPLNERVIGVGSSSIYVVYSDDLDVQRIRRHPWP